MPDGSVYDGEFRDNIQNGYGVFHWPDGTIYEGPWRDGKRHGAHGILVASDGFRYEGSWVNNTMEGRGVATYPKGQVYDGTWVAGRREGRGTIRFTNGAVCEWSNCYTCFILIMLLSNSLIPLHYKKLRTTFHDIQDEGRFKDDYMEGQGTMKMTRNVIIPRLVSSEDEKQYDSREGSDLAAVPSTASTNEASVAKNDWMIPLQFQSDISHIHQKAGFTQIGF